MSSRRQIWVGLTFALCVTGLARPHTLAAEARSIEQLLTAYRPMRPDVEIETPPAADFKKCKVTVEVHGKISGWVVLGPAGQGLPRVVHTGGERAADESR